jgi:hypothetical protein
MLEQIARVMSPLPHLRPRWRPCPHHGHSAPERAWVEVQDRDCH